VDAIYSVARRDEDFKNCKNMKQSRLYSKIKIKFMVGTSFSNQWFKTEKVFLKRKDPIRTPAIQILRLFLKLAQYMVVAVMIIKMETDRAGMGIYSSSILGAK